MLRHINRHFRSTVVPLFLAMGCLTAFGGGRVPVDVVKVMSFSCSFCLAAEGGDKTTELAAKATGGRFVRAPVPSLPEDTGARERLYYSARDMSPDFGERVKGSLYRGAQEAQVPMFNFMQVYTWITEDLAADEPRFTELFKKAQDVSSSGSLSRAVGLAINAGVTSLPTYILLVNGQIKGVVDTSATSSSSAATWRAALSAQINQLSNPNATSTTP